MRCVTNQRVDKISRVKLDAPTCVEIHYLSPALEAENATDTRHNRGYRTRGGARTVDDLVKGVVATVQIVKVARAVNAVFQTQAHVIDLTHALWI